MSSSKATLETAARSLSPAFPQAIQHKQLLRLPAVIERTGLSKTAIYTTPTFPRPVKLTSIASAWLASEVDAWIDARLAARDASPR